MNHIDTLQMYEDLVATGITHEQAKVHVHSLDKAFDHVVTIQDLKILENDLKIYFGNLAKGTLFLAFIVPITIGIVLKLIGVV